jgi:hypothetical protein
MATGFVEWWDTYVLIGSGYPVGALLVAVLLVAALLVACRRAALRVSESLTEPL